MPSDLTPNDIERFWSKVDVGDADACWNWRACLSGGYGSMMISGRARRAHRVSWEIAHSEAPTVCVLHRCDNPACVNPAHLFLGTQADNIADMEAKGRARKVRGEAVWLARLTETAIPEIRRAVACGESFVAVARKYGVTAESVRNVAVGRTWVHAPGMLSMASRKPGDKTHCANGHAYDVVNTYWDKTGKRHCRACGRQRARWRREANAAT
jgi:hypothetical protein